MKFLNDIVLTGAGADLTAPATVTFSGLSATTETNAVVVNSSGVLSKRTLGSNAFNSTTIPTNNNQLTNGNSYLTDSSTQTKYLRSDVDDTFLGELSLGSTSSRRGGIYGFYDSFKIGHIWGMGTSYKIPENGANFGNLYGAAYKHTNNTTGGTMASGHQLVWCQNGSGTSAIGTNIWTSGSVTASGKIQGAELEGTSLDINGNADISGNLTGVNHFTATGKIQGAELEGTSLDINGNGDVSGNLYVSRYFQSATGVPTNNLGTPTVTEMALFENQFKPQTTLANSYNNLADLTFFCRTSGTSESDYSEETKTDDQKRKFLRTHNSSCYIPNGANSYRIEFVAHNYTFANAMIAYWSSNSHIAKVQVYKRRCSDNAWIQHTSSNNQVSSWPGHLYLPFGTIAWHETNTSSTGHYNKIRIEFTPEWTPYSGSGTDYSDRTINIYGMQIWGGYPSGRRTVHSYDQNGKLNLFGDLNVPGNITTNGTVDGVDISGLPTSFAPTNATNNSSNATLLARGNHTGTQTAGTISDFDTEVSNNTTVTGNSSDIQDNSTDISSNGTDISTNATAINGKVAKAGDTMSGPLVINQNGDALDLRSTTNASPTRITFSSDVPDDQVGHIEYTHSNTASYGGGEALILGGNQGVTVVLADGQLMYDDGIYSKPASGTGAGTRKDANWDSAYTHSTTAHAPSNATHNSGNSVIDWTSDQGSTNIHAGNYTDTDTVYTHPTSAGNKHIPTGGESGQFLKYTSSGTAVWATPSYTTNTNTTYTTATSSTLGLVKIGYTESGKNYPVELSSGKMYVNVPWTNTQNDNEEDAAEGTKGVVALATEEEVAEGTDTSKATTARGVKGAIDSLAVPVTGNKTISGTKTFSSTIAGDINGNSATTSERTITTGEISAISTNTGKVGITTGSQTIAGSKTFSSPIKGQVIGIGSHSSYINKTAAQFATDGTDKVYIGSNNYGWNDARDYATNFVDVDAPVINQNDQHNGIICPVNLSQVSIMSQVRMNAADGTMQVRVYKMARASGVNTSNLALTQIATASVSTVNGRMTTLDATGSTAVSAGDLIIVGFGKTSGGAGQKPRINFTLTGTTV